MNFYYRLQCENYDELLIENNIGNFCDKYLLARETEKNVYITFDIDTLQGYKKIDYFLNYLLNRKKENFKIIVFLPVCAFRYSEGHLLDLLKSGIEIACHGYDHSGKMQFDNEIKISEKLKKIKEFSIKFKVTKFRAPAFILTQNLYDKIKLDFQEDWSVRDAYVKSGHLFGCFYSGILYDDNFILRILNTLPDCDYVKTKFDDKMILKLMFDKLRYLEENNFSPILLFHPEPQFSVNARNFEIFKQIITYF